jgi:peptidoglycan/LPS O-acetylase OafA/YrhL
LLISTDKIGYRWDIQGLRAIAVLAVVIFHINPSLLPGGFLGVDVFFVISGYLIIGFIWRDLQQKKFTLLDFYARRIKRLFPAFLMMVVTTSSVAYFLLLPEETVTYGYSLLYSLIYGSNFYFYTQSDYFNNTLTSSPLLHTWSLAVEEQFYLIFPLIILAIFHRKSTCVVLILVSLAIFSLLLSELLLYIDPSLSFYASPSRFWQFILGGVVALSPKIADIKCYLNDKLLEAIAVFSLGILVLCLFFYHEGMLFPGVNAILPSLATVLIIFSCKKNSYSYRLLSCHIAKFFGKISYSLYLWHWPIITFYLLSINTSPVMFEQVTILALSVVAGYLSWSFIEQPAINRLSKSPVNKVILCSIAVTAFFTIFSGLFITGLTYRYTEQQLIYSSYINYDRKDYYRQGDCFLTSKYNNVSYFNKEKCINYSMVSKNTLLIGDSHAAHWYSSLEATLSENNTLSQVTSSGCKPVSKSKGAKRCTELMQWVFDKLVLNKRFDSIILSARWLKSDIKALKVTTDFLENYTNRVIVLGPIIEYRLPLPRLLAINDNADKTVSSINYNDVLQQDKLFSNTLNSNSTLYMSVLEMMCPEQRLCQTSTENGVPLQYDYGHLTHEGALVLVGNINSKL